MRLGRIAAASTLAVALAAGTSAVASAEISPAGFEEHRFSGSSTSAHVFQDWFEGKDFVLPEIETMDLTELKVNEFQTAHAGDVIYKDDQGRFWIKQHAVVQ